MPWLGTTISGYSAEIFCEIGGQFTYFLEIGGQFTYFLS